MNQPFRKRVSDYLLYQLGRRARLASSKRLAQLGSPRTVVDVGAGYGTSELYKAFPRAALVLVDPVQEYEPHLRAICEQRPQSRYVLAALGARKEQQEIQVDPNRPLHSSFHDRTSLTQIDAHLVPRLVNVTTLDHLAQELTLAGPFGLKIDTEGFELDVIRGGARFLADTQFVIAEVSVLQRFEGSYTFEEFIKEMGARGFKVFDILSVVKPDSVGTRYADIAFVRQTA